MFVAYSSPRLNLSHKNRSDRWEAHLTNIETEQKIRRNYGIRNQRLSAALTDGATRTNGPVRATAQKCDICNRVEHGGGLVVYRRRDGSDLLTGGRCDQYLSYLIANPGIAQRLLR
jgi:hypothetical protein